MNAIVTARPGTQGGVVRETGKKKITAERSKIYEKDNKIRVCMKCDEVYSKGGKGNHGKHWPMKSKLEKGFCWKCKRGL